MSSSNADCEERWSRAGFGLNTLNRYLHKHLQAELQTLHLSFPRITDVNHPFFNCLSDSNGDPLRFAPDNHPTPPNGDGVQVCYRALPHYEAAIHHRKQTLQQTQIQNQPQEIKKLLQSKNQPIPIQDENHLAFIFLPEYYNKQPGCDISKLDPSATLTILSRAQCFTDAIKTQAVKVRDEVRNPFSHQNIPEWTPDRLNEAFLQMKTLATMMPNNGGLLQELKDDLTLDKETLDFIHNYVENIQQGNIPEIFIPSLTIKTLPNNPNEEKPIFIPRRFVKVTDKKQGGEEKHHIYDNIEDVLEPGRTCLIKGESGMGKSYFTSHLISKWASKEALAKSRLCIHIPCRLLEKGARLPMGEMIFEYSSLKGTTGKTALPFSKLETLSKNGELSFIIDGLDEVEKIKDVELGAIMTKVAEAKVDPSTPVNAIELIVGILRKQIFNNCTIIAAGRPLTVHAVHKNILKTQATVVDLLEFTEDNIIDLVHKLSCSDNVKCKESPLSLCLEIIEGMEKNPEAEMLAKNPALCTSLIRMFKDRAYNGEVIQFDVDSGCSLQLQILLRNITHNHDDEDKDISFTTLDDDISKSLYEAASLCYESLVKGEFIMRGTKETDGNNPVFVPEMTGNSISLENLERMQLFKIVEDECGQMSVETKHLIIQETLAAAVFAVQDKDEMLKNLYKLNLDRLVAILSYISSLLKPKSINANFLQFMRKRSKAKTVKNKDRLQELYTFVLERRIITMVDNKRQESYPFYHKNRKLSDYQVYMISRMVAISGVKCPGLSVSAVKKSGKQGQKSAWTLVLDNIGFGILRVGRDLLKFVDLQSFPPAKIHVLDECWGGALSTIKTYLDLHPDVSFRLDADKRVEIYNQSDILAYHWLTERGYINPRQLSRLGCSAKLNDESLPLVLQAMLMVKDVTVCCDQTDTFWRSMKQAMMKGEHNVKRLELHGLTLTESIIDDVFACLMCASEVCLVRMNMEDGKWTKMSQLLAQQGKHGTVKTLVLHDIVLNDKIIDCVTNVEALGLQDMKLDMVACDGLAAALGRDDSKTERIDLTKVTFDKAAVTPFTKCLRNIKTIGLNSMNIIKDLAVGLSCVERITLCDMELDGQACKALDKGLCRVEDCKTKTMQLTRITFTREAAKYFNKCLRNIKTILMKEIEITESLAVGLICVEKIHLENIHLDVPMCQYLGDALSRGDSRTESIQLEKVTFAQGAVQSFRKCLENIKTILLVEMEIRESLAVGLNCVERIELYDMELDAVMCHYLADALNKEESITESIQLTRVTFVRGGAQSFSKCLTNIKSISVVEMEITESLAVGVNCLEMIVLEDIQLDVAMCQHLTDALVREDSRTEIIQLKRVTFAQGAAQSFKKCLRNISIISLMEMEITKSLVMGLNCVESIVLFDIQLDDTMCHYLGDALSMENNRTKSIQLERVTLAQGAAESFSECLENIKTTVLVEMEITKTVVSALSSKNNKSKLLSLDSIKVDETDEATEYFVNCVINTHEEVQLNNMDLKDAQWDALADALNNGQEKKIRKLLLTTSWGTPFVPRDHWVDISPMSNMNFPSATTPITASFYHQIFASPELASTTSGNYRRNQIMKKILQMRLNKN